jgi:hypothetical protein
LQQTNKGTPAYHGRVLSHTSAGYCALAKEACVKSSRLKTFSNLTYLIGLTCACSGAGPHIAGCKHAPGGGL